MMSRMVITTSPRASDVAFVQLLQDGDVLLVPFVLPLRVPRAALELTVAEWLGLEENAS